MYVSWSTSELRGRLVPLIVFKPSSDCLTRVFFCEFFLIFKLHGCLCHNVLSVSCSHVVTSWGKPDLLALFGYCVFLCFCHFPISCPGSGVVLGCIDHEIIFWIKIFWRKKSADDKNDENLSSRQTVNLVEILRFWLWALIRTVTLWVCCKTTRNFNSWADPERRQGVQIPWKIAKYRVS